MKKRILSIFISIIICLSLSPMGVFADYVSNETTTTAVIVDINWDESNDIASKIMIGGKTYPCNGDMSTEQQAYLDLLPETAEKLEAGSLDITVSPSSSIWARKYPVTVTFVHLEKNHWRCDVYDEIKVTLKWDYTEPPAIDILKNKFLTAKYADGTECVISPADIRVEKNAGDETVLYLNLLPYDNTHGEINIDINPNGGAVAYRYDQTADKQKEGLLSWIFTLHNGGDFVNLKGTVIFDDNNDEAGMRGKEYPIHLIATGTKSGAGSKDSVIFEERLFFDCANTSWERKYLPVKYGEYDLTWNLWDDPINYDTGWSRYTITHEKNGNQFTSTFTLRQHPLSNIRIEWVGDETDTSYRPSSLDINVYKKSTASFLWSTEVTAAEGWSHGSTGILNDDNNDDWMASIRNLPATYKYEGPIVSADGRSVTFVCTKQNNFAIKGNVYWYDGEPRTLNHPSVTIALSNGKETVATRPAGGNKRMRDTVDFGLRDSTDESENPYYYSIAIDGDVPPGYTAIVNGFDIAFIRTGTVFGFFRWYDNASQIPIERPSWIKEDPQVTLLERVYGQDDSQWIINGAEATVDLDDDRFDFGTIPFGIINDDPETRRDFHLAVDISKIPGAAGAAITKPAPIGGNNFKCSGTVKIVMEPAMACVPFTISVEDEGFHPEKTFTVTLVDSKGTEVATRECTVKQNVSPAPFWLEFEKKSLADENYELRMLPVADDDRWTADSEKKDIILSVHYNEETDTIEATPTGDDPVFYVSYKHVFDPVTVQGKFNVTVHNENPNAAVPDVDFTFTPYVNDIAQVDRTAKNGGSILLSETVSQPGEIVFTMKQEIFDSTYWKLDEVSRSVIVKVDFNENGELTADYEDGNERTFSNVYTLIPDVPNTGDNSRPFMMILALFISCVSIFILSFRLRVKK